MPIRVSGSFRRYVVPRLAPRPDDDAFLESLREHRFRSIDDAAAAHESAGWIAYGSAGSTDFRAERVFFGPCVLLRIRVDKKKLPSNALKVRLAEALAELGASTGERVSRAARTKLKDEIERELLERTIPATAFCDAIWRPRDEALLVGGTGAGMNETFVRLFQQTFGEKPVHASATPLAGRVGGSRLDGKLLQGLAPLQLDAVPGEVAIDA